MRHDDIVNLPEVGGWRPRIREAIVDFPEPEKPTSAVVVCGLIVREIEERIGAVGREG